MTDTNKIHDVTIHAAIRRNNSVNGNPTWSLETSAGTFLTGTDAALGYSISNYTNSRHPDTFVIGDGVPPVTLVVTSRGRRVVYIERDGKVMH